MLAKKKEESHPLENKNHLVVVTRRGEPDVLQMVEEELPQPGEGEVRVKIQAAGVSAYDLMLRRHTFPGDPKPPYTQGEDIVGLVDKLGAGVQSLEAGQMVAGYPRGGGYAEFICLPASELVPVPQDVDPAEAVCLVTNYLTAYMLLHPTAHVQSGERILVHGAAGGTGSALIELGKLAGLELYGTASSHNHQMISSLGATPIDYHDEDFVKRVLALTGGGVDVAFDPVGGARQIWRSGQALRKGGRLISYGMAASTKRGRRVIPPTLLTVLLLNLLPNGKKASMSPNLAVYARKNLAWYRDTLAELLQLLAEGKLHPAVAGRFPLAEAANAHYFLESGIYAGKIVLVTGLE
jgi:NADPH:quinone reductase-like Zn-dependent oxidoreductase